MIENKSSGILCHISSLPSDYGSGDLGPKAYKFCDQLKNAGQSYWQILPLSYPDEMGCPYAAYSAFGVNTLLISPELLIKDGLVSQSDINQQYARLNPWAKEFIEESRQVNFAAVKEYKTAILNLAYENLSKHSEHLDLFHQFKTTHSFWLDDFALFYCLTESFGNKWTRWPKKLKNRNPEQLAKFTELFDEKIDAIKFFQYLFFDQWSKLKIYANNQGIKIIGDIPIYVSHHSMDVWSWQEGFNLDEKGEMKLESGAPPDDFSEIGQKWGSPTYRWSSHKDQQFEWWSKRIEFNLRLYDIIRIDHFLGFYHLWQNPADAPDARSGYWELTPGVELLEKFKNISPGLPFIAEDLGLVDIEVHELRDQFNLPGMKIFQFALGENCADENTLKSPSSPYLNTDHNEHHPSNTLPHTVVYTGTHDNNTLVGWLNSLQKDYAAMPQHPDPKFKRQLLSQVKRLEDLVKKPLSEITHWDVIDVVYSYPSFLSVIPIQDILGLGSEARFNLPGTQIASNWSWRFKTSDWQGDEWNKLKTLTTKHQRLG